MSIEIADVCA